MQIKIDKHLTPVPVVFAQHGDFLTLDVDPGKVTIDGEHNLAELLARIEELEGKVEELERDVDYLQNQVREREHHMNRAATRLVWGEQNIKEALQILMENMSPPRRVTP